LQCYGSFALFVADKDEDYSEPFKEFFHFFSSSHFLLRKKGPTKPLSSIFQGENAPREAASAAAARRYLA